MMLISIDSGDPREIEQALKWGFPIDKVTSNPTTVSRTIERDGGTVYDVEMQIRNILRPDTPISVETLGAPDYKRENMRPEIFVEEALKIVEWDPHFVVKLPAVPQGLEAARMLREYIDNGRVKINFTLIFSRHQGMLAAIYGGTYASPFVGRIDAKVENWRQKGEIIEREAMDLVMEMTEDYRNMNYATFCLTASTRTNPEYLKKASEYGSHVVTMPFGMFEKLYGEQGEDGIKFIKRLRDTTEPYFPSDPRKPTYDVELNYSFLTPWERELLDEGVDTFLSDAERAGYKIL